MGEQTYYPEIGFARETSKSAGSLGEKTHLLSVFAGLCRVEWRLRRVKSAGAGLEFELLDSENIAFMRATNKLTNTLTMVRTICCEGYRECGRRCSICPNRPENRQAILNYKQESLAGFGCDLECARECGILHPSANRS